MKHVHILNTDKFVEPYIKLINTNFDNKRHKFICVNSKKNEHLINTYSNVYAETNLIGNLKIYNDLIKADQIYIHSLIIPGVVELLILNPWLLKKCNWIIWGSDLYYFREKRYSVKRKIWELVRKTIIKNMGSIVTLVKGDYYLAKEWYKVKGKYFHGAYVNPISKEYLDSLPKDKKKSNAPVAIQIGNSADPSNKHIDAMLKISKFKNEAIEVYVPLSYGNKEYAKHVIKEGKKFFGKNFFPMLDFLPPDKYSEYLNKIDIAIFNNDRQQALGNINALLYLNKKVLLRSDTSMMDHYKEKFDIHLEDISNIEKLSYSDFIKNDVQENEKKISCTFEESYLIEIWEKIFRNRS